MACCTKQQGENKKGERQKVTGILRFWLIKKWYSLIDPIPGGYQRVVVANDYGVDSSIFIKAALFWNWFYFADVYKFIGKKGPCWKKVTIRLSQAIPRDQAIYIILFCKILLRFVNKFIHSFRRKKN